MSDNIGSIMHSWLRDLFPICRSITGDGVRETLAYIQKLLPSLKVCEVPSGTQAFDWTIPDEWNIKDAFVADQFGRRVIDFKKSNLHIVGYSVPIDEEMSFEELDKHLYSLPDQPEAVPYVTSYYKRHWGFCVTENLRNEMRKNRKAKYHVKIDSRLEPGFLTYGEVIVPGQTTNEILFSTYICHPSMANNELSGPVVAIALSQYILANLDSKYTYRILFLPETIGPITYLSQHYDVMKENTVAGFVLSCLGNEGHYTYIASRLGNTLTDRVAKHVLQSHDPNYYRYTFQRRGSDERQYCSPRIDLPVCGICRTRHGDFPEYHTSLDNINYVTPNGLQGSLNVFQDCIYALENNRFYISNVKCEPYLGKYGLSYSVSTKEFDKTRRLMLDCIAFSDGQHDALSIAEMIGVNINQLAPIFKKLLDCGILREVKNESLNLADQIVR